MKYLFIGGPWDQQWHHVPDGRPSWRVPESPPARFDPYDSWAEQRIHLYTLRRALVPGWLIPLTFFVHESIRHGQQVPRGTVLPGYVQGAQPDGSRYGSMPWGTDLEPPWSALHEAAREWNRRRKP